MICDSSDFKTQLLGKLEDLMAKVSQSPEYRRGYLQKMESSENKDPMDTFVNGVTESIDRLHHHTSWTDKASGKRVSFGVVRVANIKPCIALTKALAERGYFINAYHSEDLKGRRWVKERQLDQMFSRGSDPDAPLRDPEIRKLIEASTESDIKFVLIATPVEEVGRDHDFDWAVIEPSSVASIVHMSGRVNRHRKVQAAAPNVAILDRNLRSLKSTGPATACFENPGNGLSYSIEEQSLSNALDPLPASNQDGTFPINSMLQFGYQGKKPRLAADDENSCWRKIKAGLKGITGDGRRGFMSLAWTSTDFYREFPLREQDTQRLRVRFSLTDGNQWVAEEYQFNSRNMGAWVDSPRINIYESECQNLWGTPSFRDLKEQFRSLEEPLRSTSFETSLRLLENIQFDAHFGGH